jgi:hypothetical protein
VLAQLAEWPELVRERTTGDDDDSPIGTPNGLTEHFAERHHVGELGGLTGADRHPLLVALQVRREVHGGVPDGEVRVVIGMHPGVGALGRDLLDQARQLRIADDVVRHLRVAAR